MSEVQIERIDGRPYVFGSREHHDAIERGVTWRQRLLEASALAMRLDANQTAFLARDLTYVSRDVQKVLYDKLKAAEFIPVKSEVPRGAQTWTYRQIDIRGQARMSAHLSADDPPNADVSVEEFPFPVSHVTESYQYSLDELEAAAFAGVPLARDKAEACAELIARGLDQAMRIGDVTRGIYGFFNNPNVPVITLGNGEWDTATAAQVLADLQQIEQAVITNGRDNHEATRMLAPTTYDGVLRNLSMGSANDKSVFKYFFGTPQDPGNSRMLKELFRWIALDSASGTETGATDDPQAIVYPPDPKVVFAEIPIPYEELPPQPRNYAWVVPARAVFAGVTFKRPKACAYVENLD